MKTILSVSFVLILNFITSFSKGQCDPNGIFTRPDLPVNPQIPSLTNNFDWMRIKYKLNTAFATPGNDSIFSPIYQPDNDIIDHLRLSLDMKPQDGWELLRREFGYNHDGTFTNPKPENPYIVMYNKYSSILRVFFARGTTAQYNAAKLSITFNEAAQAQSSLLDLSDGVISLDSLFRKNKIFQSTSRFVNNANYWFYADFPMQYDPCTCYYESRLNISVDLINNANIDLSGTATGKLLAINSNSGSVNQNNKTFSFND